MPRITYGTTLVWLIFATMHVTAQQPAGAAAPRSTVARSTPPRTTAKILPGTRPNVFSAIQGNALTSTNAALANASVRLRDARVGEILEAQTTDQAGLFAFRTVNPGSYIVEIVGEDHYSVLYRKKKADRTFGPSWRNAWLPMPSSPMPATGT